jgi:hypothetical protein
MQMGDLVAHFPRCCNVHFPEDSEFDCVVNEICEYLPQAKRIGKHHLWQPGVNLNKYWKTLPLCFEA